MSRYRNIAQALGERIACGEFASAGRLPSCQELTVVFGVSYVTISRAIRELELSGLVVSKPGHGIYVVPEEERGRQPLSQVGFIMPTRGDLFGNYFTPVLNGLGQRHIQSVPLTDDMHLNALEASERIARMKGYAESGYMSLVVDGDRCFPFAALNHVFSKFRQVNFVLRCDSGLEFAGANRLVCDYRQAGRELTSHLLSQGVRRIVFLTFEELDEVWRRSNFSTQHSHDQLVFDGIEDACRENGVDFSGCCKMIRNQLPNEDDPDCEQALSAFLQKTPGCRCGIIAIDDGRARYAYRAAVLCGLAVGRDVAVTGLFDTALSEVLSPRLTTVNIGETEIAELTMKAITGKWRGRTVMVKPRLIVKESSLLPSTTREYSS
ncbi:MAG: substrate-binding domain-containing protein [Lentisphaeria bacterium]